MIHCYEKSFINIQRDERTVGNLLKLRKDILIQFNRRSIILRNMNRILRLNIYSRYQIINSFTLKYEITLKLINYNLNVEIVNNHGCLRVMHKGA